MIRRPELEARLPSNSAELPERRRASVARDDTCPDVAFRHWAIVIGHAPCYAPVRKKEVTNADHYHRDHGWNASRVLLGILGLRVRGLVVRRRLLAASCNKTVGGRMRLSDWGRALVVSSLLLCLPAVCVLAEPREEFARETGLDADLISILKVDVGGTELTVVFVFINDRALASKVDPTLRQTLLPFVGQNALYVNPSIKSVVPSFDFNPLAISVQPVGGALLWPSAASWIEITPGFMNGLFQVNPAGPSQGSGSEGILVLGDSIDPTQPFEVVLAGQRVRFQVSATAPIASTARSVTSSHEPISVPVLTDVSTIEQLLALDSVTSESMAGLLGLDRSLVRILDTRERGQALRLVFVHLTDAVRSGSLGADLLQRLDPIIGTGAVMVWAASSTGTAFSPWSFYVQQGGTNHVFFSSASFVELTQGFLKTTALSPGAVIAGVIRLPKRVDASAPFSIYYGTSGVSFP